MQRCLLLASVLPGSRELDLTITPPSPCADREKHAQCSEPFYRATVADAIAADPDAEMAEKRKMLDMLRRFESAAAEGEDSLRALESEWEGNDDGDDDEAALATALEGVDLGGFLYPLSWSDG